MEKIDKIYIDTYFKGKTSLESDDCYYRLKLIGEVVEAQTEDEYLPSTGVLTYSEKNKGEDGLITYLIYPNSILTRLKENTVLEAYDGEMWETINNLPTPYLRVKHFIRENCERVD